MGNRRRIVLASEHLPQIPTNRIGEGSVPTPSEPAGLQSVSLCGISKFGTCRHVTKDVATHSDSNLIESALFRTQVGVKIRQGMAGRGGTKLILGSQDLLRLLQISFAWRCLPPANPGRG